MSPSSVAVSMSWLDALAYGPFERANGMRLPPTMAARRVFTGFTVSATLCRVKEHVSGLTTDQPRVDGRSARWNDHRVARREELIDAALAAIDEYGSEVGMDKIPPPAPPSKPVIYRYFADKNELYRAVGKRVIARIVDALQG